MKIYAARRASDSDNPFASFVGKPYWVRVQDITGFGSEYWYVKVLSMSDFQVEYQCIHQDYLKNDAVPLYDYLGEFAHWHYINRAEPKEFFMRNKICEPLDILTDDEVFSRVIKNYDGEES